MPDGCLRTFRCLGPSDSTGVGGGGGGGNCSGVWGAVRSHFSDSFDLAELQATAKPTNTPEPNEKAATTMPASAHAHPGTSCGDAMAFALLKRPPSVNAEGKYDRLI